MKKNMNIIQIKGIRGLIIAGFIVCCLAAGFIVFPGMVCMKAWNYLIPCIGDIPQIGLIQGILLWGIMVAVYFLLKKDRVVVCFKSPQGLSEEELKSVFADIKKQSETDPVLQAMLKARETELKLQATKEQESENSENTSSKV